jgi:hypothetical protein
MVDFDLFTHSNALLNFNQILLNEIILIQLGHVV